MKQQTVVLNREDARRFYDRFGARQDDQGWYEDPPLRTLLAHAELPQAEAVFEFGCGTGRFAEQLLEHHLPATATYLGVDASSTMVGLAGERLERFSGRAKVLLTNGEPRAPIGDAGVDRFLSTYVLDLLSTDDIAGLLAEARRALRPGGLLGIVGLTHGTTPLSRLVSTLWRMVHTASPKTVGGCRPLEVMEHVAPAAWELVHREVVVAAGIPSEVVVLQKQC